MKREGLIKQMAEEKRPWDLLIIGGGATGLGVAVDASSRGYRVLLVEQHDFAKATSSRSTKLVHGGVRYLQQGDVSMVVEALHERGRLWRNAPPFGKGYAFHYRQLSLVGTSFLYHRVVLLRFVGRAIGLGTVFAFVQETDLEGAAGTAARSFARRRGLPRRAIRRFENGDYIDAECS